jgi:hypothetical protein
VRNPNGIRGSLYLEMHRLACIHAPEAMQTVVELMRQRADKKVALMAAQHIQDRAFGRPRLATGPAWSDRVGAG